MIYRRRQMLLIKTIEDQDFDRELHPPHFRLGPERPLQQQIQDWEKILFKDPITKPKIIMPPFCTRIIGCKKGTNPKGLPQLKDFVIFTQYYFEKSIDYWEKFIIHLDTIYPRMEFELAAPRRAQRLIPKMWHTYVQRAQYHFLKHHPQSASNPYEIDMETAYLEDHMEAFMKTSSKRYFKDFRASPFINLSLPPLRSLSLANICAKPEEEEDLNDVEHAGIFLVTMEGHILLLKSTKHSSNPYTYMPPKGQMEPGERPIEAALRELREETGILENDVEVITVLKPCTYFVTNPKFRKKTVLFFIAIQVKQLAIQLSHEHCDYVYASIFDLHTFVKNDHILNVLLDYHESARDYIRTYPDWLDLTY